MTRTPPPLASQDERPRLKSSRGWFAAGVTFGQALETLSDGAFRLFAYLCLNADRRTGRYPVTQRALASRLGKSRRIIGRYVRELEEKKICHIQTGKNQFDGTIFEIGEHYWPYQRLRVEAQPSPWNDYGTAVRECFIALGCGTGQFEASETRLAVQLENRGIPLDVVEGALLLGACRKYVSWINGARTAPIGSLTYFEPLIAEVQQQPLLESYKNHLRSQLQRLSHRWARMEKPTNNGV